MSQSDSATPSKGAVDSGLSWLRGTLGPVVGWRPGLGIAWRGGLLFSAGAVLLAFLGRQGVLFESSMEVAPLTGGGPAPDGIVYYLPKSVIQVQATYRLVRCEVHAGENAGPPVAEIEAEVTQTTVAAIKSDLARGYVIKASTIGGGFWNTDMKVELIDGRLARLSVRGDSTLPAPRPSLNPVTNVGAMISFPKAPGPAAPDPVLLAARERICGKVAVDALDHPTPAKSRLLSVERRFHLEPGGPCAAGAETIQNGPAHFACRLGGASTVGTLLAMPDQVAAQLARYDLVVQLSDILHAPQGSPPQRGLVYLIPGSARLMICQLDCNGSAGSRVFQDTEIQVPQFGREASFPIDQRLFSDRATELEFGTSGELKSVHFVDTATEAKKEKAAAAPAKQPAPPN